jgi:hypothetical protein
MTKNLHRMLTEAGRFKYPQTTERYRDIEDAPDQEAMRPKGGFRFSFGDNLGAFRKWLRSQVNRPWDKVYSDICKSAKPGLQLKHVKDHVCMEVTLKAVKENGKICYPVSHYFRYTLTVGALYVNDSGILCKVRKGQGAEKSSRKVDIYTEQVGDRTIFTTESGLKFAKVGDDPLRASKAMVRNSRTSPWILQKYAPKHDLEIRSALREGHCVIGHFEAIY